MSEKQYSDPIYDLDGKISVSKAIPFGLQHILAMFVANIAPILIVAGVVKMPVEQSGALVQSAMLVAGIGTLIQLYPIWRVGSGLPIVMGISFTFVSIACVIGAKYGYGGVMGAVLVGLAGRLFGLRRKILAPSDSADCCCYRCYLHRFLFAGGRC